MLWSRGTPAAVLFTLLSLALAPAGGAEAMAPEGIPRAREDAIRAAAPAKPRAAPKRERRVLVFSTPAHLMEQDPHKGYCVPYGACAMRVLGEKSGAFRPVESDDVSVFLPESIRGYDAIVLNNACGAWITPDGS